MAKPSSKDCIRAIKEAEGEGIITETEAKEILDRMTRKAIHRAELKGISIDNAVREIAGEIVASEKTMAAIDKRNKLLTILKLRYAEDYVSRFPTWGEGVVAFLRGTTLKRQGGGLGIDQQAIGLRGRYIGRLIAEMERDGVLDDFKHGRHARDFYLESAALASGKRATKNESAYKMAKIYRDIRREVTARLNRAGAFINEIPDYILMQTHNMDEIRRLGGGYSDGSLKASREKWVEFVLPLLDPEKTFEGMDPQKFLRNVHEALYTGVHGAPTDEIDVDGFRAHGSLANKLSSGRVLWFKDADAAFKYNQRFGTKEFNRAILSDLSHRARNIAIMENLGPNGEGNLDLLVNRLLKKARSREDAAKQVDSLKQPIIKGTFKVLSGQTEITHRPTLSDWADKAKFIATTSKLGFSLFSSLADKATLQSEMAFQGVKGLNTFVKQFTGLIGRSKDRQQQLRYAGFVSHSLIGNISHRFGIETRTNRKTEGWLNKFFDLNGMNWWTDRHMESAGELMSAHLGDNAGFRFDELPQELSGILKQYDISAKEWDAIRGTVWTDPDEGYKMIWADKLQELPDSVIDGLVAERGVKPTAANRRRTRDQLDAKFRAYIADRVQTAVPTQGTAERYVTSGGATQRGTYMGEAIRLMFMFKSFPITVTRKVLGREIYGRGFDTVGQWAMSPKGKMNIAMLIAATGAIGYISNTIKDMLRGRTPRELISEDGEINTDVWLSALARGGGAGILGDFLFSEYDRQYKTALGALAGPVIGQLDPILALASKTKKLGDVDHGITPESVGSDAMNLLLNNTPYMNLFYVRPVMDYFVFWHLKEMFSPGILRRQERNVRDKNHQDFFITPSEVVE
jgi:hypothetical protein